MASRRLNGLAGIVAIATVPISLAQDGEPVLINPRGELRPFVLLDLDLALEFEWRLDEDTVEPRDAPRRRDREQRLREFLDVDATAFVGHPNLLEIDFSGRFGLQQRDFDLASAGRSERVDETLINFDVSGLFFQKRMLPITLYARRSDNTIDRQFSGSLDATVMTWGGRAQWRDPKVPFNIEAFRREQRQIDRSLDDDFRLDQNTLQLDGRVEMSDTSRLWWDYTYDDISQSGDVRTSRAFERQEANVNHTYDFGDLQRPNQLRSRVRWYDESGDLDINQLLLNERLRLEHTPTLASWYDFNVERFERSGITRDSYDGRATVRHQLFDSVTTIAEVGGSHLEIPSEEFDNDELFALFSIDYNKQVPLGVLLAGLDLGWSESETSDRGQPIDVINDAFTFDPGDLVLVPGRNITDSSILVTDASGTITYTEGIDYTVLILPDRVEIRRIPGGAIPPGDIVLVDYQLGPEPGGTTNTNTWGVQGRYRFTEGPFRGFQLYTRYRDQNEDRSPFSPDFAANDFSNLVYGVEYDIGPLHLLAEQEHQDSTLSPFDKSRLEGRWIEQLDGGSLVLSAFYQEIERNDLASRTATTTLAAEWNQRFTSYLRTSLHVEWRDQSDTFSGDSDAFEQDLEVQWRYHQTTVYAEIRNAFLRSETNDTTFQTLIVGLRREF